MLTTTLIISISQMMKLRHRVINQGQSQVGPDLLTVCSVCLFPAKYEIRKPNLGTLVLMPCFFLGTSPHPFGIITFSPPPTFISPSLPPLVTQNIIDRKENLKGWKWGFLCFWTTMHSQLVVINNFSLHL